MSRSHLSAADGVVGIDEVFQNAFLEEVPFWTTPSAPLKDASRLLIDVASTPPISGGEWRTQYVAKPPSECEAHFFLPFVFDSPDPVSAVIRHQYRTIGRNRHADGAAPLAVL